MSYNSFSRPRFYTNTIEYLYNKGYVTSSIDSIFLSSNWHRPKNIEETLFSVEFSSSTMLADINYILFMGCSDSTSISIDLDNDATSIHNLNDNTNNDTDSNPDSGRNINTYSSAYGKTSFIIMGVAENEFFGKSQIDITVTGDISGICVGNYFDVPYNPDLGIKKTISYEGNNTIDSVGGKTFSFRYGDSKPYNPFSNTLQGSEVPYDETAQIISSQNNIPTGRRSYELSYSYIGSSSDNQNHLFPRDFNYSNDMANLSESLEYESSKQNLYTSVINKTIGSHIPFIFSLNGSESNELMIARFTNKSFQATEKAPNVHNISLGIREVW
tara:strand:+ start:26529 stop:27515 length:987 start_codon:yes stop_codon:yes gene_type:complete